MKLLSAMFIGFVLMFSSEAVAAGPVVWMPVQVQPVQMQPVAWVRPCGLFRRWRPVYYLPVHATPQQRCPTCQQPK